ncbi:MAG: hypothetical protein ACLP3B_01365, partial [Syntrophobacteraceae bacterium]
MANGKEHTRLPVPPYVAYRTLSNFLDSLRIGIPQQIDRSLMKSMSGGLQSHVMAALGYLDLIRGDGMPTEKMHRLVNSEGAERQDIFKSILVAAYPFLFEGECELTRATARQLTECFSKVGASGNTIRKCETFFVQAAKEAGIALSPHIVQGTRTRISTFVRPKRKFEKVTLSSQQVDELLTELPTPTPLQHEATPQQDFSLEKMLLEKY